MRIFWASIVVVAACGPKGGASGGGGGATKDFTLHDKLLVRTGEIGALAYEMVDVATGARTALYAQAGSDDSLWDVTWAGRCVVYVHGDGKVDVIDPVTSKRWTLDDGNGGVSVIATSDGVTAAWDCVGDAGPSICVTKVDNSDEIHEVATSATDEPLFPMGWHCDEVVYRDGPTLYAVSKRGGTPREVGAAADETLLAPGAGSTLTPDDQAFVVQPLDGGAATTLDLGADAGFGDCDFAGPTHVACWHRGTDLATLRLHDLAGGAAVDLATGVADARDLIGEPSGAGAAYVAGPAHTLTIVRGDAPPRALFDGVFAIDDWRP